MTKGDALSGFEISEDLEVLNRANNPGCFPLKNDNDEMLEKVNAYLISNGESEVFKSYEGCRPEDLNKPGDCHFPAPGFSCIPPPVPDKETPFKKAEYVLSMYRGGNPPEKKSFSENNLTFFSANNLTLNSSIDDWYETYKNKSSEIDWVAPFDLHLQHL